MASEKQAGITPAHKQPGKQSDENMSYNSGLLFNF